jgi:hypothetical protein
LQVITNTIYVLSADTWTAPELTALCQAIIAWYESDLAPQLSTDHALTKVVARDLTTEESVGVEVQGNSTSHGTRNSPALPGNVAIAMKLVTGLTGRNRRGRLFIGGLGEDEVTGNGVVGNRLDDLLAAFNGLITIINQAGGTWVVNSQYNGTELEDKPDGQRIRVPIARAAGVTTPVTTVTSDGLLDSQRRRLTGRGV